MRLKPISKRWPERYAIRLSVYRKHEEGLRQTIETDLTNEEYADMNAWMVEVLKRIAREEEAFAKTGRKP